MKRIFDWKRELLAKVEEKFNPKQKRFKGGVGTLQ
jgi:hypothetical protein